MYSIPETPEDRAQRRNAEAEFEAVKALLHENQNYSARSLARSIQNIGIQLHALFLCDRHERSK